MSSKLIRPEEAQVVEAMVWRRVGLGESEGRQLLEGTRGGGGGPEREPAWEQHLREAHAAGLREGEAAGQQRAAAELQPVMERLGRCIEEISGLRARLRAEAEEDLVKLALAIARRVLRRELAIDADAVHGLVVAALEKLKAQEICRVRVHPAQESAVLACLRQAFTSAIDVVADPACAAGAVVFETERGRLDASVESQLQEIERGLTDRLRRQA